MKTFPGNQQREMAKENTMSDNAKTKAQPLEDIVELRRQMAETLPWL